MASLSRETHARHFTRKATLKRCMADPATDPAATVCVERLVLHDALIIRRKHLHDVLARA